MNDESMNPKGMNDKSWHHIAILGVTADGKLHGIGSASDYEAAIKSATNALAGDYFKRVFLKPWNQIVYEVTLVPTPAVTLTPETAAAVGPL